jgi:hypothetical protein
VWLRQSECMVGRMGNDLRAVVGVLGVCILDVCVCVYFMCVCVCVDLCVRLLYLCIHLGSSISPRSLCLRVFSLITNFFFPPSPLMLFCRHYPLPPVRLPRSRSLLYLLHGDFYSQLCCRGCVTEPDVIPPGKAINHAQWVQDEYARQPSPPRIRRGQSTVYGSYSLAPSPVGPTEETNTNSTEFAAAAGIHPARHRFASYNGDDFLLDQ